MPERRCARWRRHLESRAKGAADAPRGGAGRGRRERAAAHRAKAEARLQADAPHISPEYLSRCVGEVAGPDGLIFNEYQLRLEHCARPRPGTYFALSPAGGLGWSVGAALGAKLAAPDRFVVATIGDGGFIFANPTACHWAAEAHELPILMVIFNNARYGAVRNATLSMFASGAAGRDNGLGLADLSPSPPFERYAEAHGAFAARVEQPADLPGRAGGCARCRAEREAPRAGQCGYAVLKVLSGQPACTARNAGSLQGASTAILYRSCHLRSGLGVDPGPRLSCCSCAVSPAAIDELFVVELLRWHAHMLTTVSS